MNFQELQYFVCLAECLNFTEASKYLYISQPTLSRKIAELEHSVGVQLFVRTKRSVDLTDEGRELLKTAREIMITSDEMFNRAKRINYGLNRRINFGCPTSFDNNNILSVFKKLPKKTFDGVDIVITRLLVGTLIGELESGRIDAIIAPDSVLRSNPNPEIASKVIEAVAMKLLVPVSHPFAARDCISLRELNHEKMVLLVRNEWPIEFDFFDTICKSAGVTLNTVQYAPDYQTIMLYLCLGKGISLIATNRTEDFMDGLVCVPISDIEYPRPMHVIAAWRKESPNPAVIALAEAMNRI